MNFDQIRVCVIDDEPAVRKKLSSILEKSLEFKVVGEAEGVQSGIELIMEQKPDAVFLDIKLRGGDAFQLLDFIKRRVDHMPAIVLNTGYSDFEYAQKAINLHKDEVVMILQKPFWEDWKNKEVEIVTKIRNYYNHEEIHYYPARITIKSNNMSWVVALEDLILLEVPMELKGKGKLTLHTTYKSFVVNSSLNQFEEQLPNYFIRINRFTLINSNFLSRYDHSEQCIYLREINNKSFNVGDKYKKVVLGLL